MEFWDRALLTRFSSTVCVLDFKLLDESLPELGEAEDEDLHEDDDRRPHVQTQTSPHVSLLYNAI